MVEPGEFGEGFGEGEDGSSVGVEGVEQHVYFSESPLAELENSQTFMAYQCIVTDIEVL